MSYRRSSGLPSPLDSAEFSSPSLQPFASIYQHDQTDSDGKKFVREFMENVLLQLTQEKWDSVVKETTFETDEPHSSLTQSAAEVREDRLTVFNIIIQQLDEIMRDAGEDKHFAVEISSGNKHSTLGRRG